MPMRRISSSCSGPSAVEPLLERHPGDVLHDQVGQAAGLLDGVDGDDVVVADGRGGLGLAGEAPAGGGAGRQLRGQHLDGHDAVQLRVEGPQHDPHAAAADDLEDLVMAQPAQRAGFLGGARKSSGESGSVPTAGSPSACRASPPKAIRGTLERRVSSGTRHPRATRAGPRRVGATPRRRHRPPPGRRPARPSWPSPELRRRVSLRSLWSPDQRWVMLACLAPASTIQCEIQVRFFHRADHIFLETRARPGSAAPSETMA